MAGGDWRFGLYAITLGFCYARGTFVFLLIIPLEKAHSQPFSFEYKFRNAADVEKLNLEGNVSVSNSGIHLAVDSNHGGTGSVGRVTSPQLIKLWDKTSEEQGSFVTQFSFMIIPNKSSRGDGFAFFIANPNLLKVNATDEIKRGGLGIGLVNDSAPRSTRFNDYRYVAVEFDTFSNDWDPRDPHVGVNVNSMRSEVVENWRTDTTSRGPYKCTIEYHSRDHWLTISFTGIMPNGKRVTQHLLYHIDLGNYLDERVVVGISAATGDGFDQYTLLEWSFSEITINDKKEFDKTMLWEGIGFGLGGATSFFVLLLLVLRKRGEKEKEEATSETSSDLKMDDAFKMGTGPKEIRYEVLVSATNNFKERHKLRQCLYKGYFKDINTYAAIQRISAGSSHGVKEYAAEARIISQLRHRNLVKLIGWCHKKNHLFLIYDYMPNGSLYSHLFHGESILSWHLRYNIALGLASALFYLQEEFEKCVFHRDIKSSNIMLDSNFSAKLGNFGLSRLEGRKKGSKTTVMAGTTGYLDPEYIITGKARKESDMFSFGVVLLEVASGRKAIDQEEKEGQPQVSLVEWVWELYRLRNLLAAADPNLNGEFDVQQMECLLVAGIWCANSDSKTRPSIRQVIKVLNFEAPFPVLHHHLSPSNNNR
ncbi:L-type lectin-domain containing receptor kinase IX.1-like [Vigna umbellata]|uniref:L-type lectin-domain containing receptor kinase IX.1-like n=1 Tax=Vigna umbellata TaxID=87088 RepID=UPI001F5F431E|nr:L-type lectin-domain containing receptor kinase IX.1-like [Vigna umbellata]